MPKDELAANKAMAYKFVAAIVEGDVDALLRLHHPDATWWMLGAGTFDLETYIGLVRTTLAQTTKRTVAITGITAEGDRVAFEAEGEMVLPGKVYRNSYHHLLIVRGGLIVSGKEYLDTAVVQAAFGN